MSGSLSQMQIERKRQEKACVEILSESDVFACIYRSMLIACT